MYSDVICNIVNPAVLDTHFHDKFGSKIQPKQRVVVVQNKCTILILQNASTSREGESAIAFQQKIPSESRNKLLKTSARLVKMVCISPKTVTVVLRTSSTTNVLR